ncbi:MAG: tetratricopeptide repeat protein, partial [candidate division WOR-3 bacterium]|nr:tetratricopeptide repeat protein [candidate division WOR-3 bacterium]
INSNQQTGAINAYIISCDICRFTPMLESLLEKRKEGAEITGEILNMTFGKATDLVYGTGGFITNFAGDAFTALFPINKDIRSILNISSTIIDIANSTVDRTTQKRIDIRIGISRGPVNWYINDNTYYFLSNSITRASSVQQRAPRNKVSFDKTLKHDIDKTDYTYQYDRSSRLFILKNRQSLDIPDMKPANFADNTPYFPEILTHLQSSGEFRKTAPVFLNFPLELRISEIEHIVEYTRQVTEEMNGYFNKTDFTDKGGVILSVFGAPTASEHMIENAIGLAEKIRERFPDVNITAGIDYGITYAGFIGSSIWQEYTVLGDIVNTASRLSTIKNNAINVSRTIKEQLTSYETKHIGNFKLKGKSRRCPVYKITSRKSHIFRFSSPFVGRDRETVILENHLRAIYGKDNTCIFIEGESGIGKTRFVYQTLKDMHLNYFYTAADAVEYESLAPLRQLYAGLMNFNQHDSDSEKRKSIEKYVKDHFRDRYDTFVPYLLDLYSIEQTETIKSLSAKEKLETLLFILKEIMLERAKQSPFVIVLDDMMWSDEDTIDFINYLFAEKTSNIGLIVIFREKNRITDKINIKHSSIHLENLSYSGVKKYLNTYFSSPVDKQSIDLLWEKSEGNPLFLEQLTMHIAENNLIDKKAGFISFTSSGWEMPANIDRLIVSRLDSLSAPTRDTIKKASVLGKEFEILLLKMLSDSKRVNDCLREGEVNKIITLITKHLGLFRHTLLYEIAYSMQFESTLKEIHAKVADLYEDVYKDNLKPYYEKLYHHYSRAGNKEYSLKYLEKSIVKNVESYSNETALSLIKEMLSNDLKADMRIDILLFNVRVLKHIADYDKALSTCNDIINISDDFPERMAEALKHSGEIMWSLGKYDKSIEYYNRAFEIFKDLNMELSMAGIYESIGLVHYNQGEYDKAYSDYDKALALAGSSSELQNSIYSNIGLVLYRQGEFDKAMKYYEKALSDARKKADLNKQAILHLRIGLIYRNKDDYERALEHYNISLRLNRKIGNRRSEAIVLGNIGQIYFDTGRNSKVLDYFFKALDIDRDIDNLENETIVLGNIANFYATLGEHSKSMQYYKEAIAIDRKIGNRWSEAIDLGNLAEVYRLQDKYDDADENFKLCIDIIRKMNARFPLAHFLLKRAELLCTMHKTDEARALAEESLTIADSLDKSSIARQCRELLDKLN